MSGFEMLSKEGMIRESPEEGLISLFRPAFSAGAKSQLSYGRELSGEVPSCLT